MWLVCCHCIIPLARRENSISLQRILRGLEQLTKGTLVRFVGSEPKERRLCIDKSYMWGSLSRSLLEMLGRERDSRSLAACHRYQCNWSTQTEVSVVYSDLNIVLVRIIFRTTVFSLCYYISEKIELVIWHLMWCSCSMDNQSLPDNWHCWWRHAYMWATALRY